MSTTLTDAGIRTTDEAQLLAAYRRLNSEGQEWVRAAVRATEVTLAKQRRLDGESTAAIIDSRSAAASGKVDKPSLDDTKLTSLGLSIDRTVAHRDRYYGDAEGLIVAGVIRRDQLPPGIARKGGMACFLPDGAPYPAHLPHRWTDEGYTVVRRQRDGVVDVRIAVSAEEQARRRERKAAESTTRMAARQASRLRSTEVQAMPGSATEPSIQNVIPFRRP